MLKKMIKRFRKTCPKCKIKLTEGTALADIYGGYNDFEGVPNNVVTMSPTGQVKLIKVMKCKKCGYSQGK